MKNFVFIFSLLFFSCNESENTEIRKPFELNHKLTAEVLIDNNYKRIWGEDVVLFEKKINNINVYYQIDIPNTEIKTSNEKDYWKLIKEKGVISFKNYQEEMSIESYLFF